MKISTSTIAFPGFKRFNKDDIPYIVVLISVVLIAYFVYVTIPFGTYDDYERAWYFILSPQTAGLDQLKINMIDGRFFTGVFLWAFFKPHSIVYFGIYRLINLILVIILSLILYAFLKRGMRQRSALLLTIIICTLPSFSIMFYFASLMGVIAGGIFSGLSVWLLIDAPIKTATNTSFLRRAILSCILLIISMQFYQPIAMFYWVFVAIALAFDYQINTKKTITNFVIFFIVFLLAIFVSFLLIKAAPAITGLSPKERTALIGINDLIDKLIWFFNVPVPQSLNSFLLLSIPKSLVLGALAFIISGLYLWFEGSIINRLINTFLILAAIPLSYLPNLVVAENWASFRSMIALSSVWVILLYFSARGVAKLINSRKGLFQFKGGGFMVAWALLAVLFSLYHSITYIVLPTFFEHRFIRYQINEMQLSEGDTIYVTLARYSDGISPFFIRDEFGIPTTAYSWGALNLTNLVLQESGHPAGKIQVIRMEESVDVPANQPGVHFLDLQKMANYQLPNKMYLIERMKIAIDQLFHNY